MFATTHVLASVVISQHTPSPWWAFFISLLSHYLLDLVPHGDKPIDEWIKRGSYFKRAITVFFTDIILITIFFFTLSQKMAFPSAPIFAAAIIGGMLPDVLWVIYELYKRYFEQFRVFRYPMVKSQLERILNHHRKIHNYIDSLVNKKITPSGLGVAIQILYLGLFIVLALYPF